MTSATRVVDECPQVLVFQDVGSNINKGGKRATTPPEKILCQPLMFDER